MMFWRKGKKSEPPPQPEAAPLSKDEVKEKLRKRWEEWAEEIGMEHLSYGHVLLGTKIDSKSLYTQDEGIEAYINGLRTDENGAYVKDFEDDIDWSTLSGLIDEAISGSTPQLNLYFKVWKEELGEYNDEGGEEGSQEEEGAQEKGESNFQELGSRELDKTHKKTYRVLCAKLHVDKYNTSLNSIKERAEKLFQGLQEKVTFYKEGQEDEAYLEEVFASYQEEADKLVNLEDKRKQVLNTTSIEGFIMLDLGKEKELLPFKRLQDSFKYVRNSVLGLNRKKSIKPREEVSYHIPIALRKLERVGEEAEHLMHLWKSENIGGASGEDYADTFLRCDVNERLLIGVDPEVFFVLLPEEFQEKLKEDSRDLIDYPTDEKVHKDVISTLKGSLGSLEGVLNAVQEGRNVDNVQVYLNQFSRFNRDDGGLREQVTQVLKKRILDDRREVLDVFQSYLGFVSDQTYVGRSQSLQWAQDWKNFVDSPDNTDFFSQAAAFNRQWHEMQEGIIANKSRLLQNIDMDGQLDDNQKNTARENLEMLVGG